ncbi:MAG TPA: hypothetical protein VGN20_20205 [Mucilaginibacter sp.]
MKFIFKNFVFAALLVSCLHLSAQKTKITKLEYTSAGDRLKPDNAIFYGNFWARQMSWLKSGYQQYIELRSEDTKEVFIFEAMPYLKSKQNVFSFRIKPGTYRIIQFRWSEDKGFYRTIHFEPVFKNVNAADSLQVRITRGEIKPDTLKYFSFHVDGGKLYYLGTWNFKTGMASFTDDKAETDKKAKRDYFNLDFDQAITELPE